MRFNHTKIFLVSETMKIKDEREMQKKKKKKKKKKKHKGLTQAIVKV